MSFNINEIRSQLNVGVARNSAFQVRIFNPANPIADIKVPFAVQATSLPETSMGVIEIPYFGRKIRVKGDRNYAGWSCTVRNDEDFLVRNALENWVNSMQGSQTNLNTFGSSAPALYKSQAQIIQFSQTGQALREIQVNGIFPITIAAIGLDWNATDTNESFDVTFAYDEWQTLPGLTGNGGGI